jgi:hypothetical protein
VHARVWCGIACLMGRDWMAVRRILSDRTEQICCVVIGLGIVVWSFLEAADRNTFAATAVIGGVVLIAAGLLIESIAEFSISARGATFKTREPDRSRATEVAAQGPTAGMEPDSDDPLELARYLAADAALEQLLRAKIDRSALEGCELHLFLWDAQVGQLVAAFEPRFSDVSSDAWLPGRGATGTAYQERRLVVVTAPETADDSYGLSPEQQSRYQRLTAVGAAPVLNAAGWCIAVVTAATESRHSGLLMDDGQDELEATAAAAARVLVDLLGWFSDDEEP